mmetsp:Transcript_7865/g.15213  ORF Transcript_7865/g.15213 Transcript_7865/m.15213 type:complete len:252 (+) Transcript_7865:140-895(+)
MGLLVRASRCLARRMSIRRIVLLRYLWLIELLLLLELSLLHHLWLIELLLLLLHASLKHLTLWNSHLTPLHLTVCSRPHGNWLHLGLLNLCMLWKLHVLLGHELCLMLLVLHGSKHRHLLLCLAHGCYWLQQHCLSCRRCHYKIVTTTRSLHLRHNRGLLLHFHLTSLWHTELRLRRTLLLLHRSKLLLLLEHGLLRIHVRHILRPVSLRSKVPAIERSSIGGDTRSGTRCNRRGPVVRAPIDTARIASNV